MDQYQAPSTVANILKGIGDIANKLGLNDPTAQAILTMLESNNPGTTTDDPPVEYCECKLPDGSVRFLPRPTCMALNGTCLE